MGRSCCRRDSPLARSAVAAEAHPASGRHGPGARWLRTGARSRGRCARVAVACTQFGVGVRAHGAAPAAHARRRTPAGAERAGRTVVTGFARAHSSASTKVASIEGGASIARSDAPGRRDGCASHHRGVDLARSCAVRRGGEALPGACIRARNFPRDGFGVVGGNPWHRNERPVGWWYACSGAVRPVGPRRRTRGLADLRSDAVVPRVCPIRRRRGA